MRAVVCNDFGPVENLAIEARDVPEPGPGAVRIAVRAAGVNFADSLMVTGGYQLRPPTPYTPGSEVAGTIDAVGDGVEGFGVGDRVLAMCWLGGFAEYVAVGEDAAVALPDSIDFERAASLVQSYSTSMFALDRRARLQAGETVLVLGAGGGVGLAAVDIAGALGAEVIAAASSDDKQKRAAQIGALHTIGYGDLKDRVRALTGGEGADVTYDAIGGETAEQGLRALREYGRFLVIGFASGDIPRLPANQILLRNRSVIGVDWGAWMRANVADHAELVREIVDLVADGKLHPIAPSARPLEEVASVMADFLDRKVVGKIVLVPSS